MVAHTKQKKLPVQWAIIVLATSLVATVLILSIVTRPTSEKVAIPVSQEKKDTEPVIANTSTALFSVPVRLSIPKIGVETDVLSMGLTADGDMEAPKTNDDAGWYKYGARPGNKGSAVIAGHFGLKGDAVFGKLGSLKKGDSVFVTDERGQKATFTVTEARQYPYDAAPKEVFTSTDGAHLNLITCDGDWNTRQNTYADRLVVFTEKVQ